jgi:hypothetical protein
MGNQIRVALAGLAAFLASIGLFGDDLARMLSHTPHTSAPPVVRTWTKHLNKKNAERVSKVACTLKDLRNFANAQSSEERWDIASEYLSEKDKVEVAAGLAEKMLQGEDIDAVDEYCDLFG